MRPLRVLVTASGAPGTAALLRALRGNGEREVVLVGCDMQERALGRLQCDTWRRVPPGSSPIFAEAVLQLCRDERVEVVLPQSSHHLLALGEARAAFADAGVVLLAPAPDAVRVTHDKAAFCELLDEIGVRGPRWRRVRGGRELARATAELGYPNAAVCFKPTTSSGSRGFRVLDPSVDRGRQLVDERPGHLAMRLEEVVGMLPEVGGDELLVMEYVEGEERTVDGYCAGGRLLLGQAKTRESVRSGLAMYFRSLVDAPLLEVAKRIVAALSLDHFVNVQLVGEAVIEVNPRVSTIVYQEDLNLPYLGIKYAIGELDAEELAAYAGRVRPTRRALRFFDQLEWDEAD